ncbi:hypothetical protein ABPG77_004459 [Micractinium sp. CCAP 211/92]
MQSPRDQSHPAQGQLRHGSGVTATSAAPSGAGAVGGGCTSPAMAQAAHAAMPPPPARTTTQTEYTGQPGSGKGAPSAGAEAREMMPGMMGPGMHGAAGEEYRRTTDNKAGYDAGTAARGGGSGGTTEAMTGGLAAGGALGDPRREGMADPRSGQM